MEQEEAGKVGRKNYENFKIEMRLIYIADSKLKQQWIGDRKEVSLGDTIERLLVIMFSKVVTVNDVKDSHTSGRYSHFAWFYSFETNEQKSRQR